MSDYVFPHQRLHVLNRAVSLAVACEAVCKQLPRGYGHIASQLRRSSTSVPLNIGEGANQRPSPRKKQCYVIAMAECGETAVTLQLIDALELADTRAAVALCAETHRMLQRLTR